MYNTFIIYSNSSRNTASRMKIIYRIAIFVSFLITLVIIIAYARGYRLDIKEKTVVPTGILAISSNPKAAKVFIDNKLKGVTDINLTLPPGSYYVEIKKDGYSTWSKKIILKGEIVMALDPLLFPTNASLSPLTNLGIVNVITVNQSNKTLLFSQTGDKEKDGIYLFDPDKKPLSLMQAAKPILLSKNLPEKDVDLKHISAYFSPDLTEAIISFKNTSYLLSLDQENKQLFDITNSKNTLINAWAEEKIKQTSKILETFPKEIYKIASDSFKIISFSPDENKVFYQAQRRLSLPNVINPPLIGANQTNEERTLTINSFYIYDKKEDKNFLLNLNTNELETLFLVLNKQQENVTDNLQDTNVNLPIMWYPDSKHLVLYEFVALPNKKGKKQITIMNYDGQNKQTIYSGPFEESFFSITNDGNIIVLVNLNPENNEFPDLYQVGIK